MVLEGWKEGWTKFDEPLKEMLPPPSVSSENNRDKVRSTTVSRVVDGGKGSYAEVLRKSQSSGQVANREEHGGCRGVSVKTPLNLLQESIYIPKGDEQSFTRVLSREGEGELLWRAMQELLLDLNFKVDCLLNWLESGKDLDLLGQKFSSQAQVDLMGGQKGSWLDSEVGRKGVVGEASVSKGIGLGHGKAQNGFERRMYYPKFRVWVFRIRFSFILLRSGYMTCRLQSWHRKFHWSSTSLLVGRCNSIGRRK